MASRLPITTPQACQKFYCVEGGDKMGMGDGGGCCVHMHGMCVNEGSGNGGGVNGLSTYYFLSGREVFAFGRILT